MNNDYKSPAFRKLLDSLQQQSWELELLISGFAIFGLFSAYEPLTNAAQRAGYDGQGIFIGGYFVVLIACYILLFNLLLHVVLRGLWIGSLGLRYVSGDIDFDKLNYADRFKKYLTKRIVSFDRYIANLENYCSILFAISFLLIFYVLALALVNGTFLLLTLGVLENDFLPTWLQKTIGIPIVIFLAIGVLLTFIDFITQGLLKKNKWVAKAYFPFYWVFSIITLSFLYRPLIYNFLDNKFGKRLILLLTPAYLLILISASIDYKNSNVLNLGDDSSSNYANEENYMDMLVEEEDYPGAVVISSKVVSSPFLQVFVPFKERIEDLIYAHNETIKPEDDQRGYTTSIAIGYNKAGRELDSINNDSFYTEYLKTFNEIYSFEIDTLQMDGKFLVTTTANGILGFETYVSLKNLSEGNHEFRLKRLEKSADSIRTEVEATVPFWHFKE